jgi:hypothetical protein
MATARHTTLEILTAQLQNHSNYRLVNLWNALQADQRSRHLVPLQDILRARGVNVRRGSRCTRKFVDDDRLSEIRRQANTRKRLAFELIPTQIVRAGKPTVEKITPKLDADRLVSKAGKLLLHMHTQAQWTPENVDPFLVRRTPGLKRTLGLSMKTRYRAYSDWFARYAWAWYRVKVHNVRCGGTFKALVQVGRTLVELRAGVRRGEQFIQAVPMAWSDLS